MKYLFYLLLFCLLSSCGQTGQLYLPPHPKQLTV